MKVAMKAKLMGGKICCHNIVYQRFLQRVSPAHAHGIPLFRVEFRDVIMRDSVILFAISTLGQSL
jgi:hypothetical protein